MLSRASTCRDYLSDVASKISNCRIDLGQSDLHITSLIPVHWETASESGGPNLHSWLRTLGSGAGYHYANRAHNNLQIEPDTPVLDVGQIERNIAIE